MRAIGYFKSTIYFIIIYPVNLKVVGITTYASLTDSNTVSINTFMTIFFIFQCFYETIFFLLSQIM